MMVLRGEFILGTHATTCEYSTKLGLLDGLVFSEELEHDEEFSKTLNICTYF